MSDFVQVHSLVSYPGVLLNRDDVGLAKRLPFGDAVRVRVSSQCLKKHWRDGMRRRHPDLQPAVRSREIFERELVQPLVDQGLDEPKVRTAVDAIASVVLRTKQEEKDGGSQDEAEEAGDALATGQVLVMSRAEVDYLRDLAARMAKGERTAAEEGEGKPSGKRQGSKSQKGGALKLTKDEQKALAAVPASFDAAMFGRFITSDLLARIDAAVSVAHAFTVHAEQAETDYFTAVDELAGGSGAAMVGDAELTSGLFYVYSVVDLDQLRRNLGLQHAEAETLTRWLVEVLATESPGAKRGSTAPYALSEFLLLERGAAQPRSLANAFRRAIRAQAGEDPLLSAGSALLAERQALATMYGDLAAVDRTALATTRGNAFGIPAAPLPAALDAILG